MLDMHTKAISLVISRQPPKIQPGLRPDCSPLSGPEPRCVSCHWQRHVPSARCGLQALAASPAPVSIARR